jgi:hypothetical protein
MGLLSFARRGRAVWVAAAAAGVEMGDGGRDEGYLLVIASAAKQSRLLFAAPQSWIASSLRSSQ